MSRHAGAGYKFRGVRAGSCGGGFLGDSCACNHLRRSNVAKNKEPEKDLAEQVEDEIRRSIDGFPGIRKVPEREYCEAVLLALELVAAGLKMRLEERYDVSPAGCPLVNVHLVNVDGPAESCFLSAVGMLEPVAEEWASFFIMVGVEVDRRPRSTGSDS